MKILMPVPSSDFDPTETGVPWKVLVSHGIDIQFSTPNGLPARADQRMLSGKGLGPWSSLLKADRLGLAAYSEMTKSKEFLNPVPWAEVKADNWDGIVLPGGHAPGMKEYLESAVLQELTVEFFSSNKLVGAICHGTVLAARSRRLNGKSVLFGRKTTALLRSQELLAWGLTYLWLKNYYRTYPETVQSEVTRSLAKPEDFISGPLPLKRDSLEHQGIGFVVEDQNYISARWPGDAHAFAMSLVRYCKRTDQSSQII